uniref:Secreted protein n=1 Tax=Rhipicephalus zambeziensis TaxID=60191 RepID=A0A224YI49_9ACAR
MRTCWCSKIHLLMGILLSIQYKISCTLDKLLAVLILRQVCLSDLKRPLHLSFIGVEALFSMNKQATVFTRIIGAHFFPENSAPSSGCAYYAG